jgi:hypothetical protein
LTAIALFLALGAVALAKQTPVERPSLALVNANSNIGSVGAMRENIGRSELCASEIILERRNRRSTLISPADWSRSCSTRPA